MPQRGLIYRVLVASPSDCIKERKAIPEVIHAWNATQSLHKGAILEPVLWESHARPELGDRPQALINKQLVENSDILIGAFWTRLGTNTGEAESGTAEEIEEFRKAGKPVLLYFSSVPVEPDSIDRDQYDALVEYRSKLESEGLIFRYESIASLREQLQRHISSTINSIHSQDNADIERLPEISDEIQAMKSFRLDFETFLRRFEAEWISERDSDPYGIDDGKFIIDSASSEVIDFRSRVISEEGTNISGILDEASKRMKTLNRHILTMGGTSFHDFWNEGNEIIELLKRVPEECDKAIKQISDE